MIIGFVIAYSFYGIMGIIMHTDTPITAVMSTSMVPTLNKGDMVFIKAYDTYDVGDIIVYDSNNIQITLDNADDIYAYQDNEPGRDISIATEPDDTFPFSSGTGNISGHISSISFTNFPNPFYYGEKTYFAYYLDRDTNKVCIFELDSRSQFPVI